MADVSTDFFDDYVEEGDDSQINEYDLTSTPNDFNILTIGLLSRDGISSTSSPCSDS